MSLTPAPVLETERLILRGPELSDVPAFARFHGDPVRAPGFGPVMDPHDSWRWWAMNIGHWHIHGYGYMTILDRASGEPAGITGIWNPSGWPEPELGWVVYEGFEGRGIAFEAAKRARDWAYEALGFTTLTSNILATNTRSQALAQRLGAVFERTYQNVHMGEDQLWRHPGPAEVAV
ncbi:GNAT family N-acetyltransferase [Litorisediminicola beolgyonensis]|uniref:GNAT family N-acetyltransferase n=1 Tax=Litorisediminicola beolgyonensis TaxID=1173614 RepID=A0ABW3ZNG8_9RHOB